MQTNPIRNKAAVIGFGYFGGIAAACFAGITLAIVISACCIAGALILGVLRKARTFTLVLLVLGAGSLVFTIYDVNTRQPIFEKSGETVRITGTVIEKKALDFEEAAYLIKTEIDAYTARVLLTAPNIGSIDSGDIISAETTLSEFRDNAVFPERTYNLSRGVLLKGDSDLIKSVKQGVKTPLDLIRGYNTFIQGEVSAAFPNDVGGLLRAVFLGDKSGLSSEVMRHIRITGVAHYTAVSGLHMTMITHMFMLVFALTPFRHNRKAKFAVLVAAVVLLAVFFNLTVSVTRAAIMLVICYGGEFFMRKGTTLNSLGFALFIILLVSPYAVFDAGLLMSFSGTFGVGVLAPAVVTRIRKCGKITESFIVSACASFCVLPVSAVFFGGISAWSPISSVMIMPFFTVAAACMGLFSFMAVFPFSLGQVPLLIAGIMSKIMNVFISFFGKIPAAWISLDYWFVPFWLTFAVTAIAVIWLVYRNAAKTIKAACLTVATLALMICVYHMNAVYSGRTYIKIYSDSTSAWVSVKQSGTKAVIVTADTPKAAEQLAMESEPLTAVMLLKSTRNNERAFAELNAVEYIPPNTYGVYDINGSFTLSADEDETLLETAGFRLLFTRASNDRATPANVTVAYNRVKNKREFYSGYIVYVSRSMPVEFPHERNAYDEPVYFLSETNKG
ncbi:MAG: ComEC/Rec2 family competence protein [Oscillospiraceae bacterium]|nr:ComEC/Rec2 family competence protein [Oscillospiraceae bacterium]